MNDDATPSIQLEPSWKARIGEWLLRPDMRDLSSFLRQRKAAGAQDRKSTRLNSSHWE